MEANQLKKVVIPAVAVAGIILLVGCLFLLGEPGSSGSEGSKPALTGDQSLEGMSDSLPPVDSPEFKDIGEGLKVWDVKVGEGEECKPGSSVTIHYTGWLLNGNVFDSTRKTGQPTTFSLIKLIRGWQLGIPGMKPGGIRRLIIPPSLGYGSQAKGSDIPANSTLVFEIKLIASSTTKDRHEPTPAK